MGRAAEAEQQVKLLQIARLAIVAAGVLRRFGCGAGAGRERREPVPDHRGEAVMVQVAGGGHDRPRRGVVGLVIAVEPVAREAADDPGSPSTGRPSAWSG